MDAIGALMLGLIAIVGATVVLLLPAGFARRLAGVTFALIGLGSLLSAVRPLWRNPPRGPGGLMTVFIIWAALVFGGIGLASGLWFGALLFGRRPMLASAALTLALAALLAGAALPPLLYFSVEVRTAVHAADLIEAIDGASAELFARSHPELLKVFRYAPARAEVLVGYGPDPGAGGRTYYLYLQRAGARWCVQRVEPVDNGSGAVIGWFTVPPYR